MLSKRPGISVERRRPFKPILRPLRLAVFQRGWQSRPLPDV
ncbi:MAG: hypothetical protein ACK53Y_19520 [bacterium]